MSSRGCEAVGIDLGTTYSALAYIDSQQMPRVVPDSSGQTVTASVVLFDDQEIVVGDIARQQSKSRADRVVQFIKVHMGEDWKQEFHGRVHTPESISAIILAHLVREAEPQIGPIRDAVITVPAFFTERRRWATQQAGEIAGLNVIGLLNEPMAAALAYGLHQPTAGAPSIATPAEQNALIYDLGGGTFDVTIIKITPHELVELATCGNRQLGGKDWDDCLLQFVADDFQRTFGDDPRRSPQALQDLVLGCEQAKRQLTRLARATVQVGAFGRNHVCEVTREDFEGLTAHLLQTTKLTTEMALEDAGLTWDQIQRVVLVGGSTHMPMVRTMLKEVSGRPADTGVNPVLAVALGAACYARLLEQGQAPKTVVKKEAHAPAAVGQAASVPALPAVHFVTAHGVGVRARVQGQPANHVLIKRNTRVPFSIHYDFKTYSSDGIVRRMPIVITQGDSQDLDVVEILGTGVVEGFPPNEPAGHKFRVTMSFNEQGRLHVSAVYPKSNLQLKMSLEVPNGLEPEKVQEYKSYLQDQGLAGSKPPTLLDDVPDVLVLEEDDDEDLPVLELA